MKKQERKGTDNELLYNLTFTFLILNMLLPLLVLNKIVSCGEIGLVIRDREKSYGMRILLNFIILKIIVKWREHKRIHPHLSLQQIVARLKKISYETSNYLVQLGRYVPQRGNT